MTRDQLLAHAALLDAWAAAQADPQQATVYREQASIWRWVAERL